MFHVEHGQAGPGLDPLKISAPARQWQSEVSIRLVLLAPEYVQKLPVSSLFCTIAQNFFRDA